MDNFLPDLDSEKRNRIINAAIEEFASFPFDKASTNNIVKKAGISKGLLFHYFDNKKALYEKLAAYVIHKLYHTIVGRIDWNQTDLFERLRQLALIKLEVNRTYPAMFDFVFKLMAGKKAGKLQEMIGIYKDYGLDFSQLYADIYTRNIDFSQFREPSHLSETINIVRWSLEKFGEEQLVQMLSDPELSFADAAAGMDRYVDILKKTFYHE